MAGNPSWKKGGASPNPSGRTKAQSDAARALARMIQAETRDGAELMDFVLAMFRHGPITAATNAAVHGFTEVSLDDKKWAVIWLANRGFGREQQFIDFTGDGTPQPAIAIPADVTDDDLDAMERVLERTLANDDSGG